MGPFSDWKRSNDEAETRLPRENGDSSIGAKGGDDGVGRPSWDGLMGHLAAYFDQTTDAVAFCNGDGALVRFNSAYESTVREVWGKVVRTGNAPEERFPHAAYSVWKRLREGMSRAGKGFSECVIPLPADPECRLNLSLLPVTDASGICGCVEILKRGDSTLRAPDVSFVEERLEPADREGGFSPEHMEREPDGSAGEGEGVTLGLPKTGEHYRMLVENVNAGILVAQEGRLVFANPIIGRRLGLSVEELLSRSNPFEFIHPDDRDMVFERHMKRLLGQDAPTQYEYRVLDGQGRVSWVEVTCVKILWEGKPATLNCLLDVTDRKEAERALRESEEKYRLLAENAKELIFTCDLQGVFTYVNAAGVQCSGYSKEELLRMSVLDVLPSEEHEKFTKGMARRLQGDLTTFFFESQFISKDGIRIPLDVNSSPFFSRDRLSGVLVVARDIRERRKMEDELFKREKLESLGILAGGIAHDFNNILSGVLGNVSLAKLDLEPGSRTFQRLLDAEEATIRAKDLTYQLLTFSKGGAPILKTTSIADILRESAEFVLRGSNVRCAYHISPDLWLADVDVGQMNRVITNLIINAVQAMPEGGTIEIAARNRPAAEISSEAPLRRDRYIEIAVKDQGCGIPEELRLKVFDPFFTTKEKGSGLGLTTAYSIVEKHRGHMTMESEAGAGTTFRIFLPAVEGGPAPASGPLLRCMRGKGRVLLMDDEPLVREVAGAMLERLGFEVIHTDEGSRAVTLYEWALVQNCRFDLVIMDLTIPGGMGGKDAVQKLLVLDPDVTALVTSGYSNDPVMAEPRKYGFKGGIPKPYTIEQLSETLCSALA